MNAFYACTLGVHFLELLGLLSFSSLLQQQIGPHAAVPRGSFAAFWYDFRSYGAGGTSSEAKLDFDHLLIACPGGGPTTTDLPLRASGLLVLPINGKVAVSA